MVSALESHLGYWLRYVSNHVSQSFAAKLAEANVSVAEWVFLRELFDVETMPPSHLATRLGMTRGAISKLADRLIARNLVARTADAEDRRYQALSLTPAGRAVVPGLSALADANDATFFGHLDGPTRKTIESAMKEIVRRQGLRTIPVE